MISETPVTPPHESHHPGRFLYLKLSASACVNPDPPLCSDLGFCIPNKHATPVPRLRKDKTNLMSTPCVRNNHPAPKVKQLGCVFCLGRWENCGRGNPWQEIKHNTKTLSLLEFQIFESNVQQQQCCHVSERCLLRRSDRHTLRQLRPGAVTVSLSDPVQCKRFHHAHVTMNIAANAQCQTYATTQC